VTGAGHIGIKDYLHNPLAASQVDENKPAVVPTSVDPAGQRYLAPDVLLSELTATVSLKQSIPPGKMKEYTS
jgi:hypothetical protein